MAFTRDTKARGIVARLRSIGYSSSLRLYERSFSDVGRTRRAAEPETIRANLISSGPWPALSINT